MKISFSNVVGLLKLFGFSVGISKFFPTSTRHFLTKELFDDAKLKWWEKFNESNACSKAIQSWINQQIKTKAGTSYSQTDFHAEKRKIMAQLAKYVDPIEFTVLAHKVVSMAKTEPSKGSIDASKVGSDLDFEQDNEDDCYGAYFFEE
ncbi:hypothetical protein Adt_21468 [Abeliophyllum distichum]|uniref:Uncharacterized protein n=1 Tax=Abeliophyllum distichum TaxID=126358 RepID=A0ABD1SZG3_9LAMI